MQFLDSPMISVVVCTFERAADLRRMLQSFFHQKFLAEIEFELLVIDNNSRDNTAAIVHEFSSYPNIKYFFEAKQGLNFARNRGVAEAKGQIVSFLDDDVLVNENWLVSLKRSFEETDADVVGGRVSLVFDVPPERWFKGLFRICLAEVDLGTSRKELDNGDRLYGANLSFRQKVFESVGNFEAGLDRCGNEMLSGGETELVRRIVAHKGKVIYDPRVFVEHVIGAQRLQWQYFIKRAHGDGLTKEILDPKSGRGFQILRVCRAAVEFLKAFSTLGATRFRDRDSYERKLAEFIALRERAFLAARFARLIRAGIE
jgi:glycosyltransferase involved in cell wall biosynthesis